MGRFSYREIEPKVTITAAQDEGVQTIDLEGLDYISQLNINASVIQTDVGDTAVPIWEVLNKIEILGNGSSVIKSYSASECRAIAAYSGISLCTLGQYGRHGTDDKTFWSFPVLFGRYPGDTKYMLDTDAWETLQAKLTWKADTTTFDGCVMDATASPEFKYAADALVYENGAPPGVSGYIKTSRIDEWTAAVSTRHPTEIPRGYPLRGIISKQTYTMLQWYNFYDRIKLDFNNGQWVPIDCGYRQLQSMLNMWWPKPFESTMYTDVADANDYDTGFGWVTGFSGALGSGAADCLGLNHAPTFGNTDLIMSEAGTANTTETAAIIWCQGMLPHHCLYIPMWKFADAGEDAIQTSQYKRIDFETTTDATGTTALCKNLAEYIVPQGQT